MRNLTGVAVEGLLGSFNHEVLFPSEWEFVILHGPNGVGKTKLFELIKATFAGDVPRLGETPFRRAHFHFEDGSLLSVERLLLPLDGAHRNDVMDNDIERPGDMPPTLTKLHFYLNRPNFEPLEWSQETNIPDFNRVLRWYTHSTRSSLRRLVRPSMVEASHLEPLLASISDETLPRVSLDLADFNERKLPDEIVNFLSETNVHLIETQRLLHLSSTEEAKGSGQRAQTRVSFLASDLVRRLREALAQNSEITQERDRTFPRRLFLGEALPKDIPNDVIIQRYNEQTKLRDRLADIGLTEAYEDLPLPSEKLGTWQRRVLWTYLDDSEEKLSSFLSILQRVELFRDIINSRFMFKKIKIDRDRGFVFQTQTGEAISADKLSSGEQHELVMVYGLLFDVDPGTLVLIDEPEISLHPAWQRKFLDDIVRISALTSLRFMLATHSPQLIHKWWDRAVALAPEEGGHDERHGQA